MRRLFTTLLSHIFVLIITSSGVSAEMADKPIDVALEKVNALRSDIGASVKRISTSIDQLSNVAKNKKNATGRIFDADVENEHMQLTKSQMLQQASIAMLAQGNASKEMMIHLIS